MVQGVLAEGQQRELHARRVALGPVGKLGRLTNGAEPMAVSRLLTSAQWSISSAAMREELRPPPLDRLELLGGQPGPGSVRRLKAA